MRGSSLSLASILLMISSGSASSQTITQYPLPPGSTLPSGIALGPEGNGNLWFTERGSNKIGRITAAGVITEFTIPDPTNFTSPGQIVSGPNGEQALWFTEPTTKNVPHGKIGRITTGGVFTEITQGGTPYGIAAGPDGNIWFTESTGNKIGRLDVSRLEGCPQTPSLCIIEFSIPTPAADPFDITAGPSGEAVLWFTEAGGNKIGRITTSGEITEFAAPGSPQGITVGPDGNLWFTANSAGQIGRITTSGSVTTYSIPTDQSFPRGITAGPGGLWFTEDNGNKIGLITTAGVITEYPVPGDPGAPYLIAADGNGGIWFTEQVGNKIGRLAAGPPPPARVTVPVAASIHGAGGSFFHSDVRVLNRSRTDPVMVTATYRCFAAPCGNSPQTFMLAPRQMRVFDDMIAATFGAPASGGAIEFSSAGNLVVTSRLYTPSRPSPTNGMGVPGIPEAQAVNSAVVTSLSHSANSTQGFRSNVGAYNANDTAQTITFTVFDGTGLPLGHTSAIAPARTPVQVSNIFNVIGVLTDVSHAYCVVSGDQGLPLLVYAGVIDNQSQDLAFVQGQSSSPSTAQRVTVPVAASIHGAGASFFHTDATVLNTSSTAVATVTATYRCFSGSCGAGTITFLLKAREMKSFDDIIASASPGFGAAESGGAIQFDSDQPIVVNSRLYTPSRPSPTNGMGVPGLPESGAPTTAVLTSLSHSASTSQGFRSNVGAYNANDVAQHVTFVLFDPMGSQVGQISVSAPPRTPVQVSNIFATIGIVHDVPNAYCTVNGDLNLPLIVYAGVIDNQSQDLAFIRGESDP